MVIVKAKYLCVRKFRISTLRTKVSAGESQALLSAVPRTLSCLFPMVRKERETWF